MTCYMHYTVCNLVYFTVLVQLDLEERSFATVVSYHVSQSYRHDFYFFNAFFKCETGNRTLPQIQMLFSNNLKLQKDAFNC